MAQKLPASKGYFNKEMRAILREGEKKSKKTTKSTKGKKSNKK